MITTAIFDFDGTIADTSSGIVATTVETLVRLGLPVTSEEQMRHAIGLPLAKCLQQGGDIPDELVEKAVEIYRTLFFEIAPSHISIFDGVKPAIMALHDRGLKLAIATSRRSHSLGILLEKHGLDSYFTFRATADMDIKPKPAPDMVLECLKQLGSTASESLVIGDTTFDMDMGNSAGCLTCGVTYGNHDRATLLESHPDYIIDSMTELPGILDLQESILPV